MKTESKVNVRPLNPDNEVEIQHLVSLFKRCSSSGILSPSVLSARFWKGAVGRRFSSLIALADGKIIAHCGFGTEKNSPAMATLTHVMIDADYSENLEVILEGFEGLISSQMHRKGLSALVALRHGDGSSIVEELVNDPVLGGEKYSIFTLSYRQNMQIDGLGGRRGSRRSA